MSNKSEPVWVNRKVLITAKDEPDCFSMSMSNTETKHHDTALYTHPAPALPADSAAQHNNAERKKQDELILEALNAAQDKYSDAAKAYLIKTATEILEARTK